MRSEKTKSLTIPPPVLGWNTVDPISEMDPRYAIEAEGYISHGATVDLLEGSSVYTTGLGGAPVGLFESAKLSGTRKLLAVANDERPYECPNGAATDLSSGGTRKVSVTARAVMFSNTLFLKGWDDSYDVVSWNGTSANVDLPAFTGPSGDDKALFCPAVYKGRLYFCGYRALSVWYTSTEGAVTGALTELPLAIFHQLGGELSFCGPASKMGDINQEYFVTISNQGEVLVFQGKNPSDSTWAIVGRYFMPPPVGVRSFFYWGPNLVIITVQGLLMLSEVFSGNSDLNFLSDKINPDFVAATNTTVADGNLASGCWYPRGNFIVINFPVINDQYQAFIMSTVNRSWWKLPQAIRFAYGYGLLNNELYFGGNGTRVLKMTGYTEVAGDGTTTTRSPKLRCAFNYLDNRSTLKQPTQATVIVKESEGLSLNVNCDVDYTDTTSTSSIVDLTDTAYKLYNRPAGLTAKGFGKAVSIRFDGSVTTKRRSIQAIEVFWEEGDIR